VNAAHQAPSLAVKIGPHLFLKRRLVKVPATNSDAKCDGFLFSFAGDILVDSNRRVDATPFTEESPNSATRAFGGYQDDIDVSWNFDFGQVFEDGREAVGEVESLKVSLAIMALGRPSRYLSFRQLRLDCRPRLALGSVTEQIHDDGAL
jgi:hypothetical protein